MKIAVSTIAFKGKSIQEIIDTAKIHGFFMEFSSGMSYEKGLKESYIHADIPRMPHNYFPPPEDSYVLNIASNDPAIRNRSIAHCKQGLYLASLSGSPFFSAHAGFCGDPKPEELGKPIQFDPEFDREVFWKHFVTGIQDILSYAKEVNTPFLIENNVCAAFNLVQGKRNPLLCSHPGEIIKLFEEISHTYFGLLLDTAHFKVSGTTLGFDYMHSVNQLSGLIKGIHHSDNDGTIDDNKKLNADYWFLPLMHRFTDLTHVVEVKNISVEEIRDQILLLEKAVTKQI